MVSKRQEGRKQGAIIFGLERTQNSKSRDIARQVSAVQSEKLLFRGSAGHCRDSQLVQVMRNVSGWGCSGIYKASTSTSTWLKGDYGREGGKNAEPATGRAAVKDCLLHTAQLLCYHSQSTQEGSIGTPARRKAKGSEDCLSGGAAGTGGC